MDSNACTELTTTDLLEVYWRVDWPSFSPSHRCKLRGCLIVMAASLLDEPKASKKVTSALTSQRVSLGAKRPEPVSIETWAARYLIDRFLPTLKVPRATTFRPEMLHASGWLEAHSKRASDITDEDLMQLRIALGGRTYQTRRTYWASVESVLHWALKSGRMIHDPSIGLPPLRRDLHSERVDEDRVPTEEEVWELARLGKEQVGEWLRAAVLLGSHAALRAGELVALRRSSLKFTADEGLWVTVSVQRRTYPRRHSDDGMSTHDYAPPKGRSTSASGKRRCYIPSRVAIVIRQYADSRSDDELLFVNSHRGEMGTDTFRAAWNRVMGALPKDHRLEGITPHSMRHAGMSMWLKQGLDLKLIQSWGGWHSLKVMLDTYAALLPGAEENSIALLEQRTRSLAVGVLQMPKKQKCIGGG